MIGRFRYSKTSRVAAWILTFMMSIAYIPLTPAPQVALAQPAPPENLAVGNPKIGQTLDLTWDAKSSLWGTPQALMTYDVWRSVAGAWAEIESDLSFGAGVTPTYRDQTVINNIVYNYAITVDDPNDPNPPTQSGFSLEATAMPTDETPPWTTLYTIPNSPNGANSWYVTNPQLVLSTSEPATKFYRWDDDPPGWSTYSTTISSAGKSGERTFSYYSRDVSLNEEDPPKNTLIKIDTTAPELGVAVVTAVSQAGGDVYASWPAATDAESGLDNPAYDVLVDDNPAFSSPEITDTTNNTNYTATQPTLTNGIRYYVRVIATNMAGLQATYTAGEAVSDASAPDQITPTAEAKAGGVIRVTWAAPSDNPVGPPPIENTGVDHYNVYRSTITGGQTPPRDWEVPAAGPLQVDDSGTVEATEYFYKVTAVDAAGNEADLGTSPEDSAIADGTGPEVSLSTTGGFQFPNGWWGGFLGAPDAELSISEDGVINWDWPGLVPPPTSGSIDPATPAFSPYTIGTAPEGTSYLTYSGTDVAGNETPAAVAEFKVDTTDPNQVTNLTGTPTAGAVINLDWDDASDGGGSGVAYYTIYYSENGGPPSSVDTPDSISSYSFTGNSGSNYDFQVTAVDNVGLEGVASALTGNILADGTAPNQPVPTATAIAGGVIRTTWPAVTDNPVLNAGVDYYDIYVATSSGSQADPPDGTVPAAGPLQFDYAGTNGIEYFVKIVAVDAYGNKTDLGTANEDSAIADSVAPTLTSNAGGSTPYWGDWYNPAPTININISEDGVINHDWPGSPINPALAGDNVVGVAPEGTTTITYSGTDVAGNESTLTGPDTYKVDTTGPSDPSWGTAVPLSGARIQLDWSASVDGGSGLKNYWVYVTDGFTGWVDGTPATNSYTFQGIDGVSYQFWVLAFDNVDNQNPTGWIGPTAWVTADGAPPIVSAYGVGGSWQNGWYNDIGNLPDIYFDFWDAQSAGTIDYGWDGGLGSNMPALNGPNQDGILANGSPVQGTNTLTFRGTDTLGNQGGNQTQDFFFDDVPPQVTFAPNQVFGDPDRVPDINVTMNDTESGYGTSWATIDAGLIPAVVVGQPAPGANSGTITVNPFTPLNEGEHSLWVYAEDLAGNGTSPVPVLLGFFKVDVSSPVGSTIQINGGATYTTNTDVTLSLYTYDTISDVKNMHFYVTGALGAAPATPTDPAWSTWETFNTTKTPFSLTVPWGDTDGQKRVWFQSVDTAKIEGDPAWPGNASTPVSATITLDRAAPDGTVSINSGDTYTNSTSVNLSMTQTGDAQDMMLSNDPAFGGASWETYGSPKAWALTGSPDGPRTVYMKLRDAAGNVSGTISDDIILDREAPTANSVMINNNDTWTASSAVTLNLASTDANWMRFRDAGGEWTGWETYGATKAWTLPGDDGSKTVYAQFKDEAGNEAPAVSDDIKLDRQAPTATSVVVNGGATYSTSRDVNLGVSAVGAVKMGFRNDGGVWSSWENYATSKAWQLADSDGARTVYARFQDEAGNIAGGDDSISDSITLDRAAPDGTLSINSGDIYTRSTSVNLGITNPDGTATQMMLSNDPLFGGASWESFGTTKAWSVPGGDGAKTVYMKVKDAAGNESGSITDTIILDTQAPTANNIKINNDAEWTNNAGVTLNLTSTGAAEMRFMDAGGSWTDWEGIDITKAWTLPGDDGTKLVYAQFRDAAGNEAAGVSDSIKLDRQAPTAASVVINGGATYSTSRNVNLALSAVGASQMSFKNDGGAWSTPQTYGTTKAWELPDADGDQTVYARFIDEAGNIAGGDDSISDAISLDRAAPDGTLSINSGATYTNIVGVNLGMTQTGGAVDMMVSNDAGFGGASWESYGSSKAWALAGSPDGTRTVYMKLRDAAGNVSGAIFDDISLDREAPTANDITINDNDEWTTDADVTLNLASTDALSGVSQMRFMDAGGAWSTWEAYSTTKDWTLPGDDGTKLVYAQFRDAAGNEAVSVSDSIKLDRQAPTAGSVDILNRTSDYTNSADVQLALYAEGDPTEMKVGEDLGTAAWVAYNSTADYTLSAGDGEKTVKAQFKDAAGNVSGEVEMDPPVILDTVAPVALGVAANAGNTYTNNRAINLSLNATHPAPGFMYAWIGESPDPNDAQVLFYANTVPFTITSLGDGAKTIYVWFSDSAGNLTDTPIVDAIILDTTKPQVSRLNDAPDPFYPLSSIVSLRRSRIEWRQSEYAHIKVTIRYAGGSVVRELGKTWYGSGTRALYWNGKAANGALMRTGNYEYRIVSTDRAGNRNVTAYHTTRLVR